MHVPPEIPADWPSAIAVPPFDNANADLVRHAAPANWPTPVAKPHYHLVVIGGGTAGLVSAAAAAGLGATVALIERGLMGGDCLNFGCVPSKALIHGARVAFAETGEAPTSDAAVFRTVMQRLRRVRADLSEADSAERFRSIGVDVFLGVASFAGTDRIRVGEQTLAFRRAIVATGARAAVPDISGLADTPFRTNETIFELEERPARLIVIGGGPIGCELAQAFARLGTNTTLLNSGSRILAHDDEDAAAIVAAHFAHDGVITHNDAKISKVSFTDGRFRVEAQVGGKPVALECEELLVATGRTPNVEQLKLEVAGIGYDRKGITVNDRLCTSNSRVFAIGDVSSPLQFTHVADAQARLAVPNALFFGMGGGRNSKLVVPWCTYTSPEVAHVGMTPADAAGKHIAIETVRVDLSRVDRAVLDDASDGFLKLHVEKGSDRILGGTLVAQHAGEMIGELALAITNGLGPGAIGRTIHPYPTQAEVFRKAADNWRKRKLTTRVMGLLKLWFRLFN